MQSPPPSVRSSLPTTSAPRPSWRACVARAAGSRSRRGRPTTGRRRMRGPAERTWRTWTPGNGRTRNTSVRCSTARSISSCTSGEWRIEAESGEELWELASTSMPPLRALARGAKRRGASPRRAGLSRLPRARSAGTRVRSRRGEAPLSTTTTLSDEVTDLLQQLIRVDTTNPPGNETAAAELLRDYLEANGVDCELIARVPERANLVARIPGGDGPSLLFLGHTDVVLADPAEWSVPPFSGELRDGMVWGRGALDMKSAGRGERRRDRVARARGLPAERRPHLRGDRRRGGRRRLRPRVALRGASRGRSLRLRDQRGRRRPDRARRRPADLPARRWRRR